jgi:DnaJ-related protein SCJ1
MLLFSTLALICLLPLLALAAEDYYKVRSPSPSPILPSNPTNQLTLPLPSQLLGVDRTASDRDLKKSYRRLSKKYHPDKNPNNDTAAQKFVQVSEAYEVLSDKELRRIYNAHGAEGVKQHKERGQGGGGGRSPFDIFNQFFGGGGHFHGGGQRRGPNMEVRVDTPLRDFYVGATHEFSVEKQVICETCSGSGSADGERDTCNKCRGQGMVIQKQQLMPGIFQQVQMQCDACGGRGSTVRHVCPACKGERVMKSVETFELGVEKGMPRGARVQYENEGDESPDWSAGDLLVSIHEMAPKVATGEESQRTDGTFFRRKERNLFWREVLSLREAWMGDWTRNLTHLDGHVVRLSRKKGEVVQPGTVDVIAGEGMPVWKGGGEVHEEKARAAGAVEKEDGWLYGALHVEYVVVLPDLMEKKMEEEFRGVWEKWRGEKGVDLREDSGRPAVQEHDEL